MTEQAYEIPSRHSAAPIAIGRSGEAKVPGGLPVKRIAPPVDIGEDEMARASGTSTPVRLRAVPPSKGTRSPTDGNVRI